MLRHCYSAASTYELFMSKEREIPVISFSFVDQNNLRNFHHTRRRTEHYYILPILKMTYVKSYYFQHITLINTLIVCELTLYSDSSDTFRR